VESGHKYLEGTKERGRGAVLTQAGPELVNGSFQLYMIDANSAV
jgi:hypothetical protein